MTLGTPSVHPIQSFWGAGFEGADHLNCRAEPLDMVGVTGHDVKVDEDYRRVSALGLRSIRESIGWRIAEAVPGRPDFSRAVRFAKAANRHEIQILWTLMHYGTPPDVSIMDDSFCERFVEFAAATARTLGPYSETPPVYTPINEISYLSWAACETSGFHPYVGDRCDPRYTSSPDGYLVKKRLVKATLMAIAAIRREDPRARFLHIDPVVHIVAPNGASRALRSEARRFRDFQWQAWDMIAGLTEPELGGSPEALDLVGLNHYHTAQWEFGTGKTLDWLGGDLRRRPFSRLVNDAWRRYRRPVVIAETGHVDIHRDRWVREIAAEVRRAMDSGAQVEGICLYPIIGRPDWNDENHWHRSGLWDSAENGQATPRHEGRWVPGRHLNEAFEAAIIDSRSTVDRPETEACPSARHRFGD